MPLRWVVIWLRGRPGKNSIYKQNNPNLISAGDGFGFFP